jgi:hypothetical protein
LRNFVYDQFLHLDAQKRRRPIALRSQLEFFPGNPHGSRPQDPELYLIETRIENFHLNVVAD